MDPLNALAAARGIPVIEDAAQSIGSEYKGRRAGSLGTIGCFSFYPTKNLGAFGDAGLCTTNDEALAAKLLALRVHGRTGTYYHEYVGMASRMDAIQAAILGVKLKYLDDWSDRRTQHAALYSKLLGSAPVMVPRPAPYQTRHIFHQFVIRAGGNRDRLQQFLKSRGDWQRDLLSARTAPATMLRFPWIWDRRFSGERGTGAHRAGASGAFRSHHGADRIRRGADPGVFQRAISEKRSHYRHHRPGRVVSGGISARQRIRGPRDRAPRLHLQHGAAGSHLRRSARARRRGCFCTTATSTDGTGFRRILEKAQPDEIYNLAAQSHVRVSFDQAEYTADVVATGTLRLLEAVRDYAARGMKRCGFIRPDRRRCSARLAAAAERDRRRFIRAARMRRAKWPRTGTR